ncbi:MAG: ABC transporter substrate-binding protein [Eubacteriales bacterium]|nr:ABC transporter substrate-binding protein [Eubacteriales bacterium]
MKKILSAIIAMCLLLSSFALAEETVQDAYTYNLAIGEFPTVWDPMRTQTNTDSTFTGYLGNGLFEFDFNEDLDGYKIVPLAAADFPVDVTADFVGEDWGIAEGDTARAWKVTIREDMTWEDGTPITAADFVYSAQARLNPKAANYRADSFYSGNLVIVGAEEYAKQGVASDTTLRAYMGITGDTDVAAFLEAHGDMPGYINWSYSFGDTYDFATETWTGTAADEVVEVPMTLAELYTFYTEGPGGEYITWADLAGKQEYALDELYAKYTYAEYPWEKVGFFATGDYEFVVILEKELQGFYLWYSMSDTWLVKQDVYEECISETDGVYSCTYGTTAETSPSWGPYCMTEFQSDKVIVLERNDNWFGFNDDPEIYQTTAIRYDYVKEPSTRLEMFLNGQLDSYGLSKDDIEVYGQSDYTYYSEGDSVFAMVFNPDRGALEVSQANAGENINKTILSITDFRTAMSLAMNRAEFCLATSPLNAPAFALYGGQIVADPDNGIFYRTTDVAKNVIVDFWGLTDEIGEGKMYATADDAIDSITGYNLEMAKQYFDAAYDQAIAQGLMDEDDVVEIMVGTPNNTSTFYNNGYEFIVNNYTEAVKGTKLEGKLTFKRDATLGNNFSAALQNNNVDMLFGVGWTGSTFDPFGLMEAYTSANYQYDPSWDTTAAMLDITLNGEVYTASVWDWTQAIAGTPVQGTKGGETVELCFPYSTDAAEAALRFEVLGALEGAVLMNYNFIPLMGDSSASLKGMQVEFYLEDEVFPMGRGGVKYMTYNYTDAEWDAFVAEQGGTLNYK